MRAFYDLDLFPRLKELAGHWRTIRDEFRALNAPILKIHRVGKSHGEVAAEVMSHVSSGGQYGWILGWDHDNRENPNWMQYGLVAFDDEIPFARKTMPKTLDLLSNIKGVKVCALSKMKPNTFLSLHSHHEIRSQGLLQFHITVDAPAEQNYAYLNVNGEFNRNVPGDAIVFDGSRRQNHPLHGVQSF
jgi:hypothetical protein